MCVGNKADELDVPLTLKIMADVTCKREPTDSV